MTLRPIAFTPFDAQAAAKIPQFETYNRTAASQRVADIVAAMRVSPGAAIVASGDAALAAWLAAAVVPGRVAILDVGTFNTSTDNDFLDRLYVPGLRRAGDLETASALAGNGLVVHNTADRAKLTPRDIVRLLKADKRK